MLLAVVDRHLQALRLNPDPAYPDEVWDFTAQPAVEKLLKIRASCCEMRGRPSATCCMSWCNGGMELDPVLLALRPYALQARHEEEPFPLNAYHAPLPRSSSNRSAKPFRAHRAGLSRAQPQHLRRAS